MKTRMILCIDIREERYIAIKINGKQKGVRWTHLGYDKDGSVAN
ncbi:hypothetical protein [Bacillus cereus]